MKNFFLGLLIFATKAGIAAGLVYTRFIETEIGWATNLATGAFVGLMVLEVITCLGALVIALDLNGQIKRTPFKLTESERTEHARLRDLYSERRYFLGFLGYVDGVVMLAILAALGWFWTMAIWLFCAEILTRVFIKDIRGDLQTIDKKLQEQEKEATKA